MAPEWWEGSIDVNKANQKAALADELMRATLTSGPMLGANRTAYGAGDWMGPQGNIPTNPNVTPPLESYNPYLHNRPWHIEQGLRDAAAAAAQAEADRRSGRGNLSPGERDAFVPGKSVPFPSAPPARTPRSLGPDMAALEFALPEPTRTPYGLGQEGSLDLAALEDFITKSEGSGDGNGGGGNGGGGNGGGGGGGGDNGGGVPSNEDNFWSDFLASRTERMDADLLAALTQLGVLEDRRRTRQSEDLAALEEMILDRNRAATGTNYDFSQELRGQGIDPSDFLQGPNREILGLLADSGNAANRFTNRMFGIDDWASTDREMALRSNAVENLRELQDNVLFGERAEQKAAEAAQASAAAKSLAHQRALEKIMLAAQQDRLSDAYSSQMDQVMTQLANEAFARNMGLEGLGDFGSMTSNMWDDYLRHTMLTPKDQYDIDLKNERLDLDTRKWLSGMGLESQIGKMKEAGIDIADLVDYMVARGITVDPQLGAEGFLSDARG